MIQNLGYEEVESIKKWALPRNIYHIVHEELTELMERLFDTPINPALSHLTFGTTIQDHPRENIRDFIIRLKSCAHECNFSNNDERCVDQLVVGLRTDWALKKVMQERTRNEKYSMKNMFL